MYIYICVCVCVCIYVCKYMIFLIRREFSFVDNSDLFSDLKKV